MLILTLKKGDGGTHLTDERTGEFIGTVHGCENYQVKVGFEFPQYISIVRDAVEQRGNRDED